VGWVTKRGPIVAAMLVGFATFLFAGCSQSPADREEGLRHFPLDSLQGVISRSGVEFDGAVSTDGGGSIRIEASTPITVRLFETDDIDVENAQLVYQAKLKTENVDGRAYLEMWCAFPGMGEFFSRGLESPLSGTNDWVTEETPFLLKKGQNPNRVKLNLVIEGTGTVWIDNIRLLTRPLQ